MKRHSALRTAVLVGLLCLFALGRVAYAAHQCYRLTAGGCGGGVEQVVDAQHDGSQPHTKVCAQVMEAPDDRGSAGALAHAAFAIAPATTLAFVPAPEFTAPPAVHRAPPPTRVNLLTSFGRLRL